MERIRTIALLNDRVVGGIGCDVVKRLSSKETQWQVQQSSDLKFRRRDMLNDRVELVKFLRTNLYNQNGP